MTPGKEVYLWIKKRKEGYLYHSSPGPCNPLPVYTRSFLQKTSFGPALKLGTGCCECFYTPGCPDCTWGPTDQPERSALCSSCPLDNTDKTSERKKKTVKLGPSYHVLTAQVRQRKPSGNCCVQARESSFTNSFFDSCFVLKLPSHENALFVAYSSNPFPLPSDFHVVTGSFSWSWELHEAPWFRRASQSLGKGWHKKVMKLCIQIPELPAPNLSLSY